MPRKLEYEQVKSFYTIQNCVLLSKTYSSNRDKLTFRCSFGHVRTTSFMHFRAGHGCPACNNKDVYPVEVLRGNLLLEGHRLIDVVRSPGKSRRLIYECRQGHTVNVSVSHYNNGKRCRHCSFIEGGKKRRLTEDRLKARNIRKRIYSNFNHHLINQRISPGEGKRTSLVKQFAIEDYNVLGWHPDDGQQWEIDHCIPGSWFDFSLESEAKACFSPSNLRWLTSEENNKRRDNLLLEEVFLFTPEQLSILEIASFKPKKWILYLKAIKNKMTQEEIDFMLANHPEIIGASSRWKSMRQ